MDTNAIIRWIRATVWAGLSVWSASWAGAEEGVIDFMPPDHADQLVQRMPSARTIEGGIRFEELRAGEGPLIAKGDRVEAIYTGRLMDGTIFNQKTGRFHTYWFAVGAEPRQIIRGWEMAMPLMRKGGRYRIAIPAQFAYREKGRPGQVPPYATVVFEIEILDHVRDDKGG